jgi:[lysine-biosynthesis-protein LysW]--L-2-aminoadipate ligase
MKKIILGYIFNESRLGKDEKAFLKLSKKRGIKLVMINTAKDLDEDELKEKIRNCNLIFNNSAEDLSMEIAKTIEEMGKEVIEPSKSFYYDEDKWMFFLKCQKHKIPTPKTILLSQNFNIAKTELEKFEQWPIILKRIEGTNGQYVDKADNLREAERIINKFWRKGSERLPIIAQEFIKTGICYRATVINGKIVQTAIKESKGWKASGVSVYSKKKFKVDRQLEGIVRKINKTFKINIYGIDLFKKNGKWIVLEINSEPSFDFFLNERNKIIGLVLDFLIKKARKK